MDSKGNLPPGGYTFNMSVCNAVGPQFFDFINQYRIEAAIKILQSPRGSQRKISAIAMDVGFNTMAAFYKAFKKHTGKTPSWYQKQTASKK